MLSVKIDQMEVSVDRILRCRIVEHSDAANDSEDLG